MTKSIDQHEGKKYLRHIFSADEPGKSILVDVYCVLKAFNVICPARQHALKKLLCCGSRGKGDALADLLGVEAAVARAIELEKQEHTAAATKKIWRCSQCMNPIPDDSEIWDSSFDDGVYYAKGYCPICKADGKVFSK